MAYLKDFRERLQNSDYPGFLKIWEEYCYGDQPDGKELIAILEAVKNSELGKHFGVQVERVLPIWGLIQDKGQSSAVLRLVLDIQTTNSEKLADLALQTLQDKYPNDPLFNEKLKLVGLRNRDKFQGCIRNFELLTHMQKGNYVFHQAGWGTGEITSVSLVREEISLEFEHVLGTQSLTFDKAFKTLIPLEKDHFYALRFGNPDDLEKQAKEDSISVIRNLLRDLGPKNAAEIKDELIDLVIPADQWNKWWQNARSKLKKDTLIESPKDLKDPFILREKDVPHEQAFYKALESKPTIHAMIQMVYNFLRDFPEVMKNAEFKSTLERKIQETIQNEHLSETQSLQLWLILEDLGNSESSKKIISIITDFPNSSDLISSIEIITFQRRCLQGVKKCKKDWVEIFLNHLLTSDQNTIRDFITQELNTPENKEFLKQKISHLLLNPILYPEMYVWYFQKIIDKKSKLPFADKEGRNRFFEGLLILLDNLEQKPQYRDLAKKVLALFLDDRYALVREIFQQSKIDEVKEYILLATKCGSFLDHDIKILYSLGEVVHPTIARMRKDKDNQAQVENIIWTTQEGYQKVQSRIQQIATVETVNNAKEIEAARALGDLRENAEFKAALERRDRLQSELKFLSDQISQARILTPDDILADEVGIGSIVHLTDSKGEHSCYTLLGPWDADPEKKILSVQSKFASAMKGKSVGEKFDFSGEKFTITDINSFFDQK